MQSEWNHKVNDYKNLKIGDIAAFKFAHRDDERFAIVVEILEETFDYALSVRIIDNSLTFIMLEHEFIRKLPPEEEFFVRMES